MSKHGTLTSNLQNGLFRHILIALQNLLGQSLHLVDFSDRYSQDLHPFPDSRHSPVLETIKPGGQAAIHFVELPSMKRNRPTLH